MRRSSLLWLASIALAGCGPTIDRSAIYVEDFETTCEGVPCGWVQSSGPDDAARYVETLPGDHGLELVGDGVSVRSDADEALRGIAFTSILAARVIARCDLVATLELRTTVELSDGRTLTLGRAITPEPTWSEMLVDQPLSAVDPIPPGWAIARVLGVSLRKSGAGSCEIDHLAIRMLDSSLPE